MAWKILKVVWVKEKALCVGVCVSVCEKEGERQIGEEFK